MVLQWWEKSVATKRDEQSLIGTLSHAATVVSPGRTFLRRMIETIKIPVLSCTVEQGSFSQTSTGGHASCHNGMVNPFSR